MARQKLFDAVIALSPDSDFPTSHLPLSSRIAAVTNEPLAEIERMVQGQASRHPKTVIWTTRWLCPPLMRRSEFLSRRN